MPASKKTPKQQQPAPFVPAFEGPIEGWVVNFLTGNLWRVARTMDRDDCLQEARLVFLRVARTYTAVTEPQHFMALFKTSWTRRFNDLSTDDSAVRASEVHVGAGRPDDSGEEQTLPAYRNAVGETGNAGELMVMIRQAPREVKSVLNLLLRCPEEILELALAGWRGEDRRTRANGSERINQLLGLPLHFDSMGAVRDYFRGDSH